jgi:hypothetical protein
MDFRAFHCESITKFVVLLAARIFADVEHVDETTAIERPESHLAAAREYPIDTEAMTAVWDFA